MNLTNLLLWLFLPAMGILYSLIGRNKQSYSTAIALTIFWFGCSYSLSAMAAADAASPGAIDRFVSEEQQELEEDLNLTPGGGHYSGVEYAERTQGAAMAASDETIQQTLEQYASDDLVIAVANGSVRVSGTVKDRDVARHVIEQIKEIPGVHEITFNLGLENKG